MKISPYKWFDVTIRYYNPAYPVGMTTETVALEAANFTEAETRVRELYKGFRPCEIQSITPALYEDVLYADSYSEVMHWYLVEFEEDHQMVQEYYQNLKDEGCNCPYLGRCSRSNGNCKSDVRAELIGYNLNSYDCDENDHFEYVTDYEDGYEDGYDISYETDYDYLCAQERCQRCGYRDYQNYTHNGNIRTIDYTNAPACFRFAGATANKAFILVQGSDFSNVLNRVKEYIYDCILDYNIFAIMQTHLCDVILHGRCQL